MIIETIYALDWLLKNIYNGLLLIAGISESDQGYCLLSMQFLSCFIFSAVIILPLVFISLLIYKFIIKKLLKANNNQISNFSSLPSSTTTSNSSYKTSYKGTDKYVTIQDRHPPKSTNGIILRDHDDSIHDFGDSTIIITER